MLFVSHFDPLTYLATYDFRDRNEQAIREEWIGPFLRFLGYGPGTLNRIEYEEGLKLQRPYQMIGRDRIDIDYRPTVLGRGLWIIEAKAADKGGDWEKHFSQAWLYASHPEIRAPLLVIADGERLTVWDVTGMGEKPELDIAVGELREQIEEVRRVLGARQVADFVREKQLHYLGEALKVQVNPDTLAQVQVRVAQLVKEAEPIALENRSRLLRADREEQERRHREAVAIAGVWHIASVANHSLAGSLIPAREIVDEVLKSPPHARPRALREAIECTERAVAAGTEEKQPRMFWFLRVVLLDACLHLRVEEGCAELARELARTAIRDHLLDFPDDQTARAAHRLERALVPSTLRQALAAVPHAELEEQMRRVQDFIDDEVLLLRRPTADQWLLDVTLNSVRRLWFSLEPWTTDTLNAYADAAERILAALEDVPKRGAPGPVNDPFFDRWRAIDPLIETTLWVLTPADRDLFDEDVEKRLVELAASDDEAVREQARKLLPTAGPA